MAEFEASVRHLVDEVRRFFAMAAAYRSRAPRPCRRSMCYCILVSGAACTALRSELACERMVLRRAWRGRWAAGRVAMRPPMAPGFGWQPGGLESSLLVPWRGERAAPWTAESSRRPPTMPKVANWLIRLLEDSDACKANEAFDPSFDADRRDPTRGANRHRARRPAGPSIDAVERKSLLCKEAGVRGSCGLVENTKAAAPL